MDGDNFEASEKPLGTKLKSVKSECCCYPVHFQNHAGFSLRVSKAGVRKTGAKTQGASHEAASFLCGVLGIVLQKVLSLRAVLVLLLLCIIIS